MNKNYRLAVEHELGINGSKNYQKAYEYYVIALQEGYFEAHKKVKYKKISPVQVIIVITSLLIGLLIDSFFDYTYRSMIFISVVNIITSLVFRSKYWYKTGFANIFNTSLLIFMSTILLPISVILPYLRGVTWIPVVILFTISFFTAFATFVITLLDRKKNVLQHFIISVFILILTTSSFFIETQDKRFSFTKVDDGVVITGYRANEDSLTIPNTLSGYKVVGIENNAFKNIQFETITLNENLTYIGNNAFSGNRQLKTIYIPDGIKLGRAVFSDNYALEEVRLPNDLEIISDSLFYNNFNLKEINIPESVITIGNRSFMYTNLETINLPKSLVSVGNEAFSYTNITKIIFPDTLEKLGSLNNIKLLEEFNIPENIKELPSNFLANNTNIKEVIIPSHIEKIGSYAFANSSIENVLFHNNIKEIGEGLFYQNESISNINLPTLLTEIPAFTFANSTISTIKLGENITKIGNAAFLNAKELVSIDFNNNLVSIGSEAFANNIKLKEVALPNSINSIGSNAFRGAYNLKKVVLPNSIKEISTGLFHNARSLTEINIPNSVINIGADAFRNTNLETIELPSNLVTISNGAFYGNLNLKSIIFNNKLERIGAYSFGNNISLIEINLPNTLKVIEDFSFNGNYNLEKVTFNSSLEFVGYFSFKTNGTTKIYLEDLSMIENWDPNWNPDNLEIIIKE